MCRQQVNPQGEPVPLSCQGWSQEDYAHRAGIHRTYVSDIERAARKPTFMIVEKLAKPLQVSASALLE